MARFVLLEAAPWRIADGVAESVRLAGGGLKAYAGLRGFSDWRSGIATFPLFVAAAGYGETGWTGAAMPQTTTFKMYPSDDALRSTLLGKYLWKGAPIEIRSGDDELAPGTYILELTGLIDSVSMQDGAISFTVADNARKLDVSIVTANFLGTGGIEGVIEAEGRPKRRSWGLVRNVEGFLLDKPNNIFEFGDPAFPLNSFVAVKDMGRDASPAPATVTWQGSIAATLTALQAATAAEGSCVVAPSIACVKWWTVPHGPLTADIQGEVGAGYVDKIADLGKRVVNAAPGGTLDIASADVTAINAVRPATSGLHVASNGETYSQALDRLFTPCNVLWGLNPDGTVRLGEVQFATPSEAIVPVDAERVETYKPLSRVKLGYRKNHRQHSDGEISAAILTSDIDDIADETVSARDNYLPNDQWSKARWTYSGTTGGAPIAVKGVPAGANYSERSVRRKVLEVPLGGNELKQAASEQIPIPASVWIWSQIRVARSTGSTAGGGSVKIDGSFRDASGTVVGSAQTVTLAIGSIPNGGYTTLVVAQQAPATAKTLDFIAAVTANTGTGSVRFDAPVITDREPLADVTMVIGYGPSLIEVNYDYTGAAEPGELPVDYQYQVSASGAVYTGAATWKYKVLTGTVNGHSAGATEYSVAGSSGVGTLTISSLGGNSNQIEVVAYINGRRRSTPVTINKVVGAAPTGGGGGGGGGGASSASQSSGFTAYSGTTFVAITGVLTVTIPAGHTSAALSSTLQSMPSGLGVGNWNVEAKFQRETTPGTWVDVGAVISGSSLIETDAEGGPLKTAADLTATRNSTGLTAASTYNFRMVARIASGSTTTRSHVQNGTVSVVS